MPNLTFTSVLHHIEIPVEVPTTHLTGFLGAGVIHASTEAFLISGLPSTLGVLSTLEIQPIAGTNLQLEVHPLFIRWHGRTLQQNAYPRHTPVIPPSFNREEWKQLNAYRVQLIHKEIQNTIQPEEQEQLNRLQQLADEKIREVAPLPIQELEAVEEELKRRGWWTET